MRRFLPSSLLVLLLVLPALLALAACGGKEPGVAPQAPSAAGNPVLDRTERLPPPDDAAERALLARARPADPALAKLVVDDPPEGALLPPDLAAPTFLWHDDAEATRFVVDLVVQGETRMSLLVPGDPPPKGEVDERAIGPTNTLYTPTPYQASARSWTPAPDVWAAMRKAAGADGATIVLSGLDADGAPLSRGEVHVAWSADPVGAPVFYRDVPLMPSVGEAGKIQPLGPKAIPIIGWRLYDLATRRSRLLLSGMPSCANCHSFSRDGKTLAMDVDGPQGDKGAYAITRLQKDTRIDYDDVITWNDFPDKPKGHRTIGFLSRVSPDGRYVVTTVNESLYVANFTNYKFLQVFFPTRGILAVYDRAKKTMRALPGADDAAYVHCAADWSPDGKELLFCRAPAQDPYVEGRPLATHPNDPNEAQVHYDLYRIPFNEGRGGTPTPVEGASRNGMSNTFPKVSPDGRWIVYTRCRNGLLMRPDGRLVIVPYEGGKPRVMRCNQEVMNSWHSWSPNGRWLVFSSKQNTPYTQLFLTHVDEDGRDTPALLLRGTTAANRAVNIPEFVNVSFDDLQSIEVPAAQHHRYYQQGWTLASEHRWKEAIPLLEKAIAAEPDFSHALVNLAMAYDHTGRTAEAIPMYEKALALDPENFEARVNLGLAYAATGSGDEALGAWTKALEVNPSDPVAHNDLGMLLARRHEFDEAERHLRLALEVDPTYVVALKNLASVLLERGRLGDARRELEKALAAKPDDDDVHALLVEALTRGGHAKEARPHLEALVADRPDDPKPRAMLAWSLATTEDAADRDGVRALELARSAAQMTRGRSVEALDALAASLAETSHFAQAVATIRQALLLAKGDRAGLASALREHLQAYEEQRPWRE